MYLKIVYEFLFRYFLCRLDCLLKPAYSVICPRYPRGPVHREYIWNLTKNYILVLETPPD